MKLIRNADAIRAFWGEVAPCEHMVQMYEAEGVFMDALESYVAGGLRTDDSIVLIATDGHLQALEQRLLHRGFNLDAARADDRYIERDAEETLAKFMVDGWPDETRFRAVVSDLLARAGRNGAHTRAFGEMVAILWSKKLYAATVRLEHLWHRFCAEGGFSLLCAYPISGTTAPAGTSMKQICEAHTHVITTFGSLPV